MKKLFICIFILASIFSNAQTRQRSNTQGFNAALSGHVLGWTSKYFLYLDEGAPSGYGGGIRLGYGITQLIEPYINIDGTSMGVSDVDAESFKMTHIDIGVRFNLGGTTLPVRPFVD